MFGKKEKKENEKGSKDNNGACGAILLLENIKQKLNKLKDHVYLILKCETIA
jgi:hypothetical protein